MRWVKIILGTVAGFAATAVLSMATTTLLRMVWPTLGTLEQGTSLVLLDAGYATAWMFVGGMVAGRIGGRPSYLALAGLLLLLTLGTAVAGADTAHPSWYSWLLLAVASPACFAGGRLATNSAA